MTGNAWSWPRWKTFLPMGKRHTVWESNFSFIRKKMKYFLGILWELVDGNRAHPRSSEYGDLFSLITTYFQHGLLHTIINLKWLLSFFRESSARVICKMLCNGALLHLPPFREACSYTTCARPPTCIRLSLCLLNLFNSKYWIHKRAQPVEIQNSTEYTEVYIIIKTMFISFQ